MTKPLEVLKAERDLILQSQKQVSERMTRTHKHAAMLFDCFMKNEAQIEELEKSIRALENPR